MTTKGDIVFYTVRNDLIRARVKRVHRDGTVTVEAMFRVGPAMTDLPGYLGYTYRMNPEDLRVADDSVEPLVAKAAEMRFRANSF